jgi:hypothetical protein
MKYYKEILLCLLFSSGFFDQCIAEYLVNVKQFGAVADARKLGEVWTGTDNSTAFNKCAEYCRAKGLTMFIPRGNYGVASTIWLVNPERDGSKQASLAVIGPNRGAFLDQSTSAKICVLKSFKPGRLIEVKKKHGTAKEPDLIPVLAISNGRQVSIEGICIQGNNMTDLICGVAIGNMSQITSLKNCSIFDTFVGLVFPGIRPSEKGSIMDGNTPVDANEAVKASSVIEGNNDLLVVEQCTLYNAYNIVCAGTQPFACEYRNNNFHCIRSVFTGTLVTNFWRHSRGGHKFSSNLFCTRCDSKMEDTVYFDLMFNEVTIDSCHFETNCEDKIIPEVLLRAYPSGGILFLPMRLAFTNNVVNFMFVNKNPTKYRPLIDTMVGNRMIFSGNIFAVSTAVRVKAYGAIFMGNIFRLAGPHNMDIVNDTHQLKGPAGNIAAGMYDFNHFIREDSPIAIRIPDGNTLKEGLDYEVVKRENAFRITPRGKKAIDDANAVRLLISYKANDAAKVRFEAWAGDKLNPPDGWLCKDLTMIANKFIGKTNDGQLFEDELKWTKRN